MNTKFLAVPLALSLVAAGCENMLQEEPDSFVTTDTFYKSAADLDAAVISAYEPLRSFDEALTRRTIWCVDLASDQARVNPNEPNFATSHPDFLGWDPSSACATNQWRALYRVNQRATLAIEKSAGIEMNQGQKDRLVGEAKFLRALSYWYLTRLFGDVPLLLTEADILKQDVSRTPRAQVIAQILKDARDAEAVLPGRTGSGAWTGNDIGRATRGAAQALQTDVHIWNRDWTNAAATALKIIQSGQYNLFNNYIDAFLPATENGMEHLFSLQATGIDDRTSTTYPTSFFPRELGFDQGGGWGVVQTTPWFFNSYPRGDYRKEVSFRFEGCSVNTRIGCRKFDEDKSALPGTPYPHVWKYRPSNGGIPQHRGDVNVPVYRYAEVLLWYAEAQNELNNPDEAVRYLNMVRARARRGTGSESRAEPANVAVMGKDALREAIFMERAWELAFEQKRWWDLVRRGPDYMMANILAHDENGRRGGFLNANRVLFPIPQSERDLNPNLTQNPGY